MAGLECRFPSPTKNSGTDTRKQRSLWSGDENTFGFNESVVFQSSGLTFTPRDRVAMSFGDSYLFCLDEEDRDTDWKYEDL